MRDDPSGSLCRLRLRAMTSLRARHSLAWQSTRFSHIDNLMAVGLRDDLKEVNHILPVGYECDKMRQHN